MLNRIYGVLLLTLLILALFSSCDNNAQTVDASEATTTVTAEKTTTLPNTI